ncbi:DUF5405 family protein [Serratia ficaria]|uniref:DUF5405 family protein n=1 Tax=Serratia ficaria TaxID=61651 RepID=UPI002179B777|nr:DUF5405 family protein [Serratia ficaria]CAI1017206.1 Uncharacterised protein [Serratia ficaria]CAI1671571.1 Uncharacterised protein [Serratia ficaria]CAI2787712.1 Uncharacterised protein [Serratia ficaria]
MHIEIGDKYVITADKYQFIVNQKMQFGNDSKHAGQSYLKQIAFCPTIGQVATVLTMNEVRSSEAKTLQEMQAQIDNFESLITASLSGTSKAQERAEEENHG